MATHTLAKRTSTLPSFFQNMDDFFMPWNKWYGNARRLVPLPAVNITENKNDYLLALAVPGMKKDDFKIDVDGNTLTISSEKEESFEEKEKKFTRREYNYSSFSRSFTLPENIDKENIAAKYEEGILKLSLPMKDEIKRPAAKKVAVK